VTLCSGNDYSSLYTYIMLHKTGEWQWKRKVVLNYVCITTKQPETKSNPHPSNPNVTVKQPAVVSKHSTKCSHISSGVLTTCHWYSAQQNTPQYVVYKAETEAAIITASLLTLRSILTPFCVDSVSQLRSSKRLYSEKKVHVQFCKTVPASQLLTLSL